MEIQMREADKAQENLRNVRNVGADSLFFDKFPDIGDANLDIFRSGFL